MRITFADILLADFIEPAASGVSVNGASAFEAIDIVLAARKKLYARGNQIVTLSFAVSRSFDTVKECEVFLLTHFSTLPKAGLCVIDCGLAEEDSTPVYLDNAILAASPSGGYGGRRAVVSYQILAPGAETDTPPEILLAPDTMIKRGSTAITNGESDVDVTFAAPFSVAPKVVAVVSEPSGGQQLFATIDESTITEDGFTAKLSAAAPASGYLLHWMAAE